MHQKNIIFISLILNVISALECSILSISGGASHGAWQAGVIHNLITNQNKNYSAFSGISAGSLNSYWLASSFTPTETLYDRSLQLKTIWSSMQTSDIYKWNDFIYILSETSLLDSTPLFNTITGLAKNRKLILPLAIGAVSVLDGQLHIFNNNVIEQNITNYLMASSAIPIAFPPIQINNELYIDGGVSEDFLIDLSLCDADTINIDIILSYSTIQTIPFEDASQYKMFQLLSRLISIANFNYFNHFITDSPNIIELCNSNVNLTIYAPPTDLPVSILDFSKGDELWNLGYNNFSYINLCNFHLK